MSNEALTGFFGAYGSDDDDQSGSGDEGAATGTGVVLLGADLEKQDAAEKEESEEENRLSALLTPSRLPEVQSVSQLAPSPANMGGSSPDGQAADAAARSGDVASTSMEASRPQLPPELTERPPGEVEPQVQKNVERLMRAKIETGKRITAELRRMRAYKNPDFLQKMVDFFGIEDIGSCYPKEVFDPKGFPKEDYYKALMQEWEAEENRKRIERNKVGPQFVKGPTEQAMTLPRGVAGTHAAAIAAKAREQASSSVGSMKRSKWDSAPKR